MTNTFTCSIAVDAPADVVFGYFTDAELLVRWIGNHAVVDARPGGEFTLDIEGIPVRGRYIEVVEFERVVVSWGHAGSETILPSSTRVQFTLAQRAGGGTLVEIEHSDLPDEHVESHTAGWPMFADRLRQRIGA